MKPIYEIIVLATDWPYLALNLATYTRYLEIIVESLSTLPKSGRSQSGRNIQGILNNVLRSAPRVPNRISVTHNVFAYIITYGYED